MRGKSCGMWLNHVSKSKVLKLLRSMKNSKSMSFDGLDNYCVKLSSDVIAAPLHHIIVLSLMQEKFPSSWK